MKTAIIILSIIVLVRILAIYSPFFSKIWIRIKKAGVPITKVFAYLVTIWCLIWGGVILDDPDFKLFEYFLIGVGIVGIGCMIVDFKHYICKKRQHKIISQ